MEILYDLVTVNRECSLICHKVKSLARGRLGCMMNVSQETCRISVQTAMLSDHEALIVPFSDSEKGLFALLSSRGESFFNAFFRKDF